MIFELKNPKSEKGIYISLSDEVFNEKVKENGGIDKLLIKAATEVVEESKRSNNDFGIEVKNFSIRLVKSITVEGSAYTDIDSIDPLFANKVNGMPHCEKLDPDDCGCCICWGPVIHEEAVTHVEYLDNKYVDDSLTIKEFGL